MLNLLTFKNIFLYSNGRGEKDIHVPDITELKVLLQKLNFSNLWCEIFLEQELLAPGS